MRCAVAQLGKVLGLSLVMAGGVSSAALVDEEKPGEAEPLSGGVSIFHLAMPDRQDAPMLIPTTPEDATVVELPTAIDNWFGRGFTANPDSQAGDFVLVLRPGERRFSVTPLTKDAHRVLHLVTRNQLLALEFIPAVTRMASYRGVIFHDQQAAATAVNKAADSERVRRTEVVRARTPPRSSYREPSTATLDGLRRFMRLLLNLPEDMARRAVAANPALQLVQGNGEEQPYGDFSLVLRFALRDAVTDTLGLCVAVQNRTVRRLVFDNQSWLLRAGGTVFPVRTVDFPGMVEPEKTELALLILDRGPDGKPTRLMPDNEFRVSVQVAQSLSARPVTGIDLTRAPK